ncbi:MAG: Asp23/Gls24 family envelope stress response protein [Oscillospiraceae bacterium]
MSQILKNNKKSLQVSQSVIAGIVKNAVKEIDGVYGIAPVKKNLKQIWLKEESMGDIKIGMVDDVLSLSIGVILNKGVKALAVSEEIQEVVKSSVQNMIGLTVARVNVTVRGIKN